MLGTMELLGPIDMRELSEISTMDRIEENIGNSPQIECPLEHFFTPEIYTRKIFMPKDKARFATSEPIRPKPTTPKVFP